MKKTIKLNNIKIEITKAELEQALKEFDKPEWELRKVYTNSIGLWKNDRLVSVIAYIGYEGSLNFNTLAREMALGMADIMPMEEKMDKNIQGYTFYFDVEDKKFETIIATFTAHGKIFKTREKRNIAMKLLNKWLDDGNKLFGIKKESE